VSDICTTCGKRENMNCSNGFHATAPAVPSAPDIDELASIIQDECSGFGMTWLDCRQAAKPMAALISKRDAAHATALQVVTAELDNWKLVWEKAYAAEQKATALRVKLAEAEWERDEFKERWAAWNLNAQQATAAYVKERERADAALAKLARLDGPDEAIVEAARGPLTDWTHVAPRSLIRAAIRAVAKALREGK